MILSSLSGSPVPLASPAVSQPISSTPAPAGERFEPGLRPAEAFEISHPYRLVAVPCGQGEALRAIDLRAFTTPWPVEKFEALLQKPNVNTRVAVTAEGSLGYFIVEHGVERNGADYLTSLGVVGQAQGKKVGERLFLEAVKISRESGAPACWLHVDVTNIGARRLYEKYGFEVAGLLPNNYPEDGHDGYEMVLGDLQSPAVGTRLAALETTLEASIRASRPIPGERHVVAGQP